MTDATTTGPTITIKTEPPDAGPRAIRGAVLCAAIVAAIVIGDVWWVGAHTAFDINGRDFNPLPLFGVVCAAVIGIIALVRGTQHTLRYRKFGSSELVVSEPRLGTELTGVVRPERDLGSLTNCRARLRCDVIASFVNARGGNTRSRSCLWESVQAMPAPVGSSAGIPIAIAIPANGLVSGPRKRKAGTDEQVTWALEIAAPLRGLPYYAEFILPMKAGAQRGHTGADAQPFAGCAAPRSTRWTWLLRVLVMFGSVVTAGGTFGIVDELRSTRVQGHVTADRSGTLDVAIDNRGTPITVHVTHVPPRFSRTPGTAMTLMCGQVTDGTYSCDPDTGLRWWIMTGIGMSVGLGMLLAAWVIRRRRRWWL